LKAKFESSVHHILVSIAYFQALSTWVSLVQNAPPHLGVLVDRPRRRFLGGVGSQV
jgi:hypothetical protein